MKIRLCVKNLLYIFLFYDTMLNNIAKKIVIKFTTRIPWKTPSSYVLKFNCKEFFSCTKIYIIHGLVTFIDYLLAKG